MAGYVGHRSHYELGNARYYWFIGAIYLIFLVLLLCVVYYLFFLSNFNFLFFLILIICYGVMTVVVHFVFAPIEHSFYCWAKGLKGEDSVRFTLLRLPDDYKIFEDLKVGHGKGNIDFAVVGPTGIFTIEVKSQKGMIGFSGQELMLDGNTFPEKDILWQTSHEEMDLHNYLLEQVKIGLTINPVLVFANWVKIKFGFKPVNNVVVIGRSYLLKYIYSKPVYNYPISRKIIEEKIKILTN